MREGRIESRHYIKSLEGMGSSSNDLGAELRLHSFTVNCDTFSNEEKVAAVVPVTSVVVACSEATHTSFEVVQASITFQHNTLHFFCLFRPPPIRRNNLTDSSSSSSSRKVQLQKSEDKRTALVAGM